MVSYPDKFDDFNPDGIFRIDRLLIAV